MAATWASTYSNAILYRPHRMSSEDVKTLQPKEAWEKLQREPSAVLIDVRSSMEYLFVGHPVGALHIPWLESPEWTPNRNFVAQVRQAVLGGASSGTPILLICRSGVRSLEAGAALVAAGFKSVYNVAEGFEGKLDEHHHRSAAGGWRYHGLPWEQS